MNRFRVRCKLCVFINTMVAYTDCTLTDMCAISSYTAQKWIHKEKRAHKFSILQVLFCSSWLIAVMIGCTSFQWDDCSWIWVQKLVGTENQNNKTLEDPLALAYTLRYFLRVSFSFSILGFFTCLFLNWFCNKAGDSLIFNVTWPRSSRRF